MGWKDTPGGLKTSHEMQLKTFVDRFVLVSLWRFLATTTRWEGQTGRVSLAISVWLAVKEIGWQ